MVKCYKSYPEAIVQYYAVHLTATIDYNKDTQTAFD